MNFSLSDLVPPLRWSDASTITLLTGQPDLPDAWWRSLPLPRVLAVIGPEALGELLTEIALEQWPAAAVGDVLPALYVLDPEEADEPHVAIALDRAGSWAGLLTLTGRELVDQPFVQARAVLGTLFSAVFARLSPVASGPPVPSAHAVEAPAAFAVAAPSVAPDVAAEHAAPGPAASEQPEAEPARVEHIEAEHAEGEPAGVEHAEVEHGEPEPAEGEHAEAEHAGPDQAAAEGPEAEHAEDEGERAEAEGAEAERAEAQEADDAEAEHAEGTAGAPAEDARAADAAGARAEDEGADAEHAADAAPEGAAPEGAAPEEADEAGDAGDAHDADAQGEESRAEDTQDDEEIAEPEAAGDGAPAPGEAPAAAAERDLSDLIEAAFAGLDDKSWAVAQNRVFTDEPSAVDQLAKLFAVPPAEIVETEAGLRALVDRWLGSDEAAPFRAHLDELRRTIGPAAPRDELIAAAPWHTKEIKALEVPAWQVVLATLPARPAQGPPAAAGGSAAPPGPPGKAGPSVFHAFTPAAPPAGQSNGGSGEHHPGVAEQPAAEEPPAVEPVPVRHDVPRGGEQQIGKPYQPLKDVSQTRRCFRQPDGRWWLRVDVTAEQLAGGECPLPTGFAAYLGLSPGETRTVRSAAGELTMTWHGRPVMESVERLLVDVGAKEGGHLFLTLSDEGVLRARHLPVAAQGAEKITKALRLVGYTAPGGTRDQAARVIATRIGLTGPVALPELLNRLRERGDRDLLALLD